MTSFNDKLAAKWAEVGPGFLPFADAASDEFPLSRMLRLSLFQFSAAMALVLLNGTLNRVMIVELGVPAWLVALMVSLPLLFAPFRALIGFRSDHYQSHLGWRRVPFLWFGSMLQFGGLAIMPFALILLSGDSTGPAWIGYAGSALAFLLVGVGMHTAQTAGLALATDLAPEQARPRVVAFLYMMLLVGVVVSSLVFGWLLSNFSQIRLIQVIQGAAVVTMVLNVVALWKQEIRVPNRNIGVDMPSFADAFNAMREGERWTRVLVALALGTAAFSMQDILLEPYGGEVLKLTVGATTVLTGLLAFGTLFGLVLAAHNLSEGVDPFRLAGLGVVAGLIAFPAVIFSAPAESVGLFQAGVVLIGFGGGLFSVGTLTAAMNMAREGQSGLALGAWGAVQATAAGLAILLGGGLRDIVAKLAADGSLGPAFSGPAVGYNAVYHFEIVLLFATLAAIGPLVRPVTETRRHVSEKFGLAELPG